MNNEPLLKAENLTVEIKKGEKVFTAVDKINFSLYPGEICGIVGESGCGKSLTALSIAGLLPPAARARGRIVFAEKNLLELSEDKLCPVRGRDISMIFQEPLSSLNPLMKIGRQITETLEIHGNGGNEKQNRITALRLMEKLGLENPEQLMDTYPFRLSGGMCQRVMIALAMICGPKLLIADEPTTALDIDTQDQILRLLGEINKTGTTVLFISHDLGVVKQICGRVMVMYAGKIIEEGHTDEVLNSPAHEYTISLLDALPERNLRGSRLRVIPGKVPSIEEERTGCPFAPRCGKAKEICYREFPQAIYVNKDHLTHCVLEQR